MRNPLAIRRDSFPRRRALLSACCTLVVAGLAFAAVSIGGTEGSYQKSSYTLSQKKPGKSTAERFVFDYVNPADPAAKPPPVRRVITVLPRKGRYDTSAPALCTASDEELMVEGAAACPDGSRIGGGVVTVDTGFPGPGRFVEAQIEFFNNTNEFIYLNTVKGTGARTVIRAEVRKRKTITEAPDLPGTPPDGGAIDTVDVTVAAVSRVVDGERRNYITTPGHCPNRGFWMVAVRFVYDNGVGQTVKNKAPCTPATKAAR